MSQEIAFLAFNRGIVSRLGLARADIKRIAMSAKTMSNWMCRVLGSMMLRPGTKYLGRTASDAAARVIPFIFSTTDTAILEFTNLVMRVWISDSLLTRPAVTSAVAGGTFPSAASLAANWTDNDEAGAASTWVAAGQVGFTGTGTNAAIRSQTVAVVEASVEHALRIVVARGPITLRVGSSAGGDEYINQTDLDTGTHSLAFTPAAGNFYIEFSSRLARIVYLTSCTVEAAGVLGLPVPWTTANLGKIRYDESADVVYVACYGYQQRKIERRGSGRSWSSVVYTPNDGPFRTANVSVTTMAPSVLTGNGNLIASLPTFRNSHIGALWSVTSTGQTVAKSMTALNDATNSIRVEGVGDTRAITIVLSGLSGTGNTVVLQRSFDNATWVAVPTMSWVADVTTGYTDGLDNQIVYYRLICTVYAAGTTVATLSIPTGSVRGVCRIVSYTSAVQVGIEVLTDFGATNASADWEEGIWSDYRGWPSAVRLYEGRLWWGGKDRIVGSESDGFENFDQTTVGDSAPIVRQIASGPVDTINFLLALQRLLMGGQGAEYSCRSTSFDEPLTPTNFNIKRASGQGSSSNVDGIELDSRGIYVQRGGIRVFELSFNSETYDYASNQLSQLWPEAGYPGIVRIGVQRQPDTRVHFVRSDGTVAVLVFDRVENVLCWLEVTTPGTSYGACYIEDVVVLPSAEGEQEDHVYYVVQRTISGSVRRFLERWATEAQAKGDADLCMLADAYAQYTGVPTTTVTAAHLAGQNVAIWADGEDIGTTDNDDGTITYTYTLDGSGNVTIPTPVTNYVVGLPYEAQWESGKLLEIQMQLKSALTSQKNINGLGIVAADLHPKGLQFGPDFDHMDSLPSVESGAPVDQNTMRVDYNEQPFVFPGTWTVDGHLCLRARSPRPATILAAVCEVVARA